MRSGFSAQSSTAVSAEVATTASMPVNRQRYNRDAFLFGIGPGYAHTLSDGLRATAQLLGGWGSIETIGNPKQKVVDEIEGDTFKGFSAAAVVGIEKELNGPTVGVNVTTHYIDGKIMPSLNLKIGFDFVLWRAERRLLKADRNGGTIKSGQTINPNLSLGREMSLFLYLHDAILHLCIFFCLFSSNFLVV